MIKTLAGMTADERADCVGMWALIEGTNLAVIAEADATNACVVVYPQWDGDSAVHFNGMVTPRYDSPRAWAPDGEPVPLAKETWEYAVQVKRSESWKYTYESWSTRWQVSYSVQKARAQRDHPGEETRIIRRRVSEPEVINE